MSPGRELDNLVAEKVIGAKRREDGSWRYSDQNYSDIPKYSTSIEDAWQVVEKLRRMRGAGNITIQRNDGPDSAEWVCTFDHDEEKVGVGRHDEAPAAICIAALHAVGYY